jgi:hypothetical protein
MTTPSSPQSRAMSPDFTDSDSDNDEYPAASSPTSNNSVPVAATMLSPRVRLSSQHPEECRKSSYETFLHMPRPSSPRRSQKSLDYETQLRLLEMQAKKRISMARLEAEQASRAKQSSPITPNESAAALQTSASNDELQYSYREAGSHVQQALESDNPVHKLHWRQAFSTDSSQVQHRIQLQQNATSRGIDLMTAQRDSTTSDDIQDFDFDTFLPNTKDPEPLSFIPTCGPTHSAPCNAAATSLLGSTLSTEEINLIQREKSQRRMMESVERNRQLMMHHKRVAVHNAVFARQMANMGQRNFYQSPNEPPPRSYNIQPHEPHRIPAQRYSAELQGPSLHHSVQGIGSRALSHPYLSVAVTDTPTTTKRRSPFDLSDAEKFQKRSKLRYDPIHEIGDQSSLGQECSPLSLTNDFGGAQQDDVPCTPRLSPPFDRHIGNNSQVMKDYPTETQILKEDYERPIPQTENLIEEITKASPAQSSATLDDEGNRSPLIEIDMDIDQENASDVQRTELDSGVSVTTTTFKDGKTMTVMRAPDGNKKSKNRALKQGVEIVTKTVIIAGVVTTTTTTALIPMTGMKLGVHCEDGGEDDDE